MNLMNAADCYPWTVIPLEERNVYTKALEKASVGSSMRSSRIMDGAGMGGLLPLA
jgi:hypothetical protein